VDVRLLDQIPSTQQTARELVDAGNMRLPGLIIAHHQTDGRGRSSHRWYADTGSLALTLILPAAPNHSPHELPLRTGLSVRRALGTWIPLDQIQIKWPNDLLVNHRKIAGILCERLHGVDLIGIGLNVQVDWSSLEPALRDMATSLHEHLREHVNPPTRQSVLIALVKEVLDVWQDDHWCDTLNAVHALSGRDIVVDTQEGPVAGRCEGIDAMGRLLVRTGERVHALLDGSIRKR
jgi:BirA family biotin operon repressor/biotin-[acetyl-CoA-carboxylase] ligase